MKRLLTHLLPFSVLLVASCSKKETPSPLASPTTADIQLNLQFSGNTGYTFLRGYLTTDCTGSIYKDAQSPDYTYFSFTADAGDKSIMLFSIHRQKLKPSIIGSYSFISQRDASNDMSSKLQYSPSGGGFTTGVTGDYDCSSTAGSFQITAYNASSKLADGRFELVMKDVRDPQQAPSTPSSQRRVGDVTLTGTFKGVKMPD